jgi:hypothetical protein
MRRAVVPVCMAVLALCGCGGGENARTTAPEATSLVLNHHTPTDFAYGDSTTLKGHIAGPAASTVQLEASPYPFRGYKRVASTRPGSDRLFEFRVKPQWNTRYRAVASGAKSNVDTVIVSLRGHFSSAAIGPHRIQVFLTGTGPRGLEPRKSTKVFFYIRRRGERRYRLMGARAPVYLQTNAIRAGGNFDVAPRRGDQFLICPRDGGMAMGLGFKKSPVPGCGRRSVAA